MASHRHPPHLTAELTPLQAYRRAAKETLRHLSGNLPGILNSWDPESVHQARVALRRFRSVHKSFHDLDTDQIWRKVNVKVKALSRLLGDLRDLDVLLHEIWPVYLEAAEEQVAGTRLKATLRTRYSGLKRKVRTALQPEQLESWHQPFKEALKGLPGKPVALTEYAGHSLERSWLRVETYAGRSRLNSVAQCHQLRKHAKDLRYGVECFSTLYDPRLVTHYLNGLQRLQAVLGKLVDYHVARSSLALLVQDEAPAQSDFASLEAWLEREIRRARTRVKPALKEFLELPPFWKP